MYKQVFDATQSACEDMFRFSGERGKPINAEYLFTVAVAREIDKLNSFYGDPYKIFLEKSRKELSRDCLPPMKRGNPWQRGSTVFRERKPAINTKERADIAVYENVVNSSHMTHQPICVIELKGFNPPRKLVIKDLKRNLEYFNITGKTGNSVIQSTLFSALYSYSKVKNEAEEIERKQYLEQQYNSWLSEVGNLSSLDVNVCAHTISSDYLGEIVDEAGVDVLDTSTIHHFMGIIVEFKAKKI
ncbi:hypothetical protein OPW19_17800 [Vibrio europaeus]|uniref:hypothetical protein n=1 Tax=Vibrio europaeus TaxID=300876 RepID=UPI00233F14EE|nr:hypothetical protein [Vibrio europaeus]MDC5821670.1 hypothetical protein [Vibrio europaeus]MDC5868666.1 hypothetical protein [Vibrio europaeus]